MYSFIIVFIIYNISKLSPKKIFYSLILPYSWTAFFSKHGLKTRRKTGSISHFNIWITITNEPFFASFKICCSKVIKMTIRMRFARNVNPNAWVLEQARSSSSTKQSPNSIASIHFLFITFHDLLISIEKFWWISLQRFHFNSFLGW